MNNRLTGIQWIAFTLLLAGVILRWIHVDEKAIVLNIGFAVFGLVIIIDGIKAKYHTKFNFNTLKLILPVLVILLAIDGLLYQNAHYAPMGVAIILLLFTQQRERFSLRNR